MLEARAELLRLTPYHPPLSGRRGLRLDFNESTAGCSPRVLERLRRLDGVTLAQYPEREPVEAEVARFLGLGADRVLLTNGVDEAIHLLCHTYLDRAAEALIVEPTFGMYRVYAEASGAQVQAVVAGDGFRFPAERLLERISDRTRLVAIANPNNPTGTVASRRDLLRIVAAAPDAAVLVDEAYFEFYGETLLDQVGCSPNLFVARTLSKAYGLAGLRIGVLTGDAGQMAVVRRITSPYNVNAAALACVTEALSDQDYVTSCVAQVRQNRAELEEYLRELGLEYWPSQANFVLFRVGAQHREFVARMREQGILVRDRSSDPGCAGCVRITVGTRQDMTLLIAALRRPSPWLSQRAETSA